MLFISGQPASGLPDHPDRHWPGAGVPDGWSLPLQIHQEDFQDIVQQPVRAQEGKTRRVICLLVNLLILILLFYSRFGWILRGSSHSLFQPKALKLLGMEVCPDVPRLIFTMQTPHWVGISRVLMWTSCRMTNLGRKAKVRRTRRRKRRWTSTWTTLSSAGSSIPSMN